MKMKIYQTVKTNLALIGYKENLRPFNERQKWIFIIGFSTLLANYVDLLHDSNTPKEYMDSIFMSGIGTFVQISHISTTFKMETIFIFINEVEEVINASKLKSSFFCSIFEIHFRCHLFLLIVQNFDGAEIAMRLFFCKKGINSLLKISSRFIVGFICAMFTNDSNYKKMCEMYENVCLEQRSPNCGPQATPRFYTF